MSSQRPVFQQSFLIGTLTWFACLGMFIWCSGLLFALVFASISFLNVWFWTQWQAQRLQHTLAHLNNPLHTIPTAPGVWGEVFYSLYKRARFWQMELAQAHRQQHNFTQAMQASPNAFVMLDEGGRVEWVNQAAQDLLGLDSQRDLGQNLAYLLRTQAVLALLDSQRLREPVMLRTNDKYVQVQAFPYGDAQTLLLGQDLTELERTDQVRRDFVANVSHELRTPLTVLTGYTELLQDHFSTHPEHGGVAINEALNHISLHTERMNTLTRDLLQLASLDEQDILAASSLHEQIDVNAWFQRVEAALPDYAVQVTPYFKSLEVQATVLGNASELDSALSNLVNNALRYTPQNGTIEIRCEVQNQHCTISVQDTGCGIAAVHLPRLTERFYRVSASRSRDSGGTGLGLAIVKHVMQRHRGELLISSELGGGSCFSLRLPVQPQT